MKKIIIIDDDERFGKPLRALCEMKGIPAEWIADADQGMARVRVEKPPLVVLDVMMPGEHGLALLDQIQADKELAGVTTILASNFDKAEPIAKAKGVEFWAKNDMSLDMMGDRIAEIMSEQHSA